MAATESKVNAHTISGLHTNHEEQTELALLKKYQRRLNMELAGLCVLMGIVWGLLMLPIIFFYLPVAVVIIRRGIVSIIQITFCLVL